MSWRELGPVVGKSELRKAVTTVSKLSEAQILKNKEIIENLVKSTWGDDRREKIQAMLSGFVGEEFFLAPASHKEEYHACYPGGLAEHTLRVVKNLRNLAKTLAAERYPTETLDFVALFHDLGKTGDGEQPYYIPHPNEWHRKQGTLYQVNPEIQFMPTQERSLYLLQRHCIDLTSDEYLAIRLHDGQYDETNKRYSMKEPDLALLLHFADRWATAQEKI